MAGTDQDLAGLPGPLADALRRTDVTVEMFDTLVTVNRDDYDIIRAELLRLATIEADALIALDCEHDWQVEHKRAEKAEAELAALQARIDALMLEFCPEDMTEEQVAAWSARQRVVDEPQDDNAKEGRSRE